MRNPVANCLIIFLQTLQFVHSLKNNNLGLMRFYGNCTLKNSANLHTLTGMVIIQPRTNTRAATKHGLWGGKKQTPGQHCCCRASFQRLRPYILDCEIFIFFQRRPGQRLSHSLRTSLACSLLQAPWLFPVGWGQL